jgi:hypothetical protein
LGLSQHEQVRVEQARPARLLRQNGRAPLRHRDRRHTAPVGDGRFERGEREVGRGASRDGWRFFFGGGALLRVYAAEPNSHSPRTVF